MATIRNKPYTSSERAIVYLAATPIGNIDDVSKRFLDVVKEKENVSEEAIEAYANKLRKGGLGKVIEGMDVVKKIEAVGTQSGRPTKKVVIEESGEL